MAALVRFFYRTESFGKEDDCVFMNNKEMATSLQFRHLSKPWYGTFIISRQNCKMWFSQSTADVFDTNQCLLFSAATWHKVLDWFFFFICFKSILKNFGTDLRMTRQWHSCLKKLWVPHLWWDSRTNWMRTLGGWAGGWEHCPQQRLGTVDGL